MLLDRYVHNRRNLTGTGTSVDRDRVIVGGARGRGLSCDTFPAAAQGSDSEADKKADGKQMDRSVIARFAEERNRNAQWQQPTGVGQHKLSQSGMIHFGDRRG